MNDIQFLLEERDRLQFQFERVKQEQLALNEKRDKIIEGLIQIRDRMEDLLKVKAA